jgi:cytochrome c553
VTVAGAVKIAKDGSTAVLVPSSRALSWQTTDTQGNPVVRERNWISFKAGEIRVCASCHGVNTRNQANFPAPLQKPLAFKEFLNSWKDRDK